MVSKSQRKSTWIPVLVTVVLLASLAAYWVQLVVGYESMRNEVRATNTRLASQSAHALALQANTLFRKLDYFSQQLSTVWMEGNEALFDRSVTTAMQSLSPDALAQIVVTDANGLVVYSRLGDDLFELETKPPVSLSDREHFQFHSRAGSSVFFFGMPIRSRLSGQWTIQFTRGMWRDNAFQGMLILGVSADHLSEALKTIFSEPDDVAFITREDGTYLAHSAQQDSILGTKASFESEFVAHQQKTNGKYQVHSPEDGVKRQYAWWRGNDYPFVVSVGYGEDKALSTVEQAIDRSVLQNVISSTLLILALAVMTRLWWLRSRHSSQLQQVQQRLEFAIKVGQLAVWDWDIANDQMSVDQEWARMFGYEYSGNSLTLADWVNKIHPDDAKAVMAAWDACLRHQTESFNKEYRVLQADGSERWIADFGQVLERDAHGKALRMVGIKQDITQRKLAQLAESEVRQQLSKLVAEVPGAVFQFRRDSQGQYSFPFASPGMEQMFGVDLEDIRNDASSILSRLSPLDFSRVIKSIESSAKSMSEWQEQVRILQKNGEYRWIAGHSKPNLLEDGSIMWYGHLQDVTAEIEVLQALKDNEAQLRLTLQAVHDGLWSYDHRSKVAQCDDRIREMLGYADDYWKNPSLKSVLGLLHPQDRERLGVELDEMMVQHAREVLWMDFRLKTHDGQWLWVQARARVVEWDEHGSPARTVGILSDISQHVAESQLRQALLDRSPAAIVKMSHDRQVIDANDGYKQLFVPQGCPFKLFDIANLFVDKEQFEQVGQAYDLLSQLGSYRIDVQMKTVDGQIRWFDMQGVLQDPTDTSSPVIWTLIDITARREADQALRAERQRLHVLLERFPAGVLIEDHQQRIVFANERWCALMNCVIEPWALTGISRDGLEDLIGKTRTRWHYESLDYPCSHPGQKLQVQDDNSLYLEIDHIDVKQADDHLGTVWFVWDITDRKLRENQLNRWATTDGLTGLPNRRWFTEVFERHLHKQDENTLSRGVLMLLDIDHFKRVNDTHGHLAGDRVLRQMAQVLRENVRASDCAARLGGEEFAIFLPDTPMEYGLQVAERIRCSIQDHLVEHEGEVVGITVSVGLTALDSNDIQELLQQADSALYQAKKSGRNSICLWGRDVGKQ